MLKFFFNIKKNFNAANGAHFSFSEIHCVFFRSVDKLRYLVCLVNLLSARHQGCQMAQFKTKKS
jgi:hypothetical protein